MTYLELIQETLLFSDTDSPESIKALADADEYKKTVSGYVREAWAQIQMLHESWGWRRKEFAAVLRSGVSEYTWNELRNAADEPSIPRDVGFRNWLSRTPGDTSPDVGPAWLISGGTTRAVGQILPISFEEWRHRRLFDQQPAESRPGFFTIAPDKRLFFAPTPNDAYQIDGMYVAGVQRFVSENDQPRGIDEEYHPIIKWRAVMMVHGSDEAGDSYTFAATQFNELLNSLERIHLPEITVGGSPV